MTQQNGQPSNDPTAIVKGKSPRNALIGVGIVAAAVIGSIGFYYQVKAGHQAAEEARLQKKAKAAEVVDRSNNTQDVDKIIADQQAAARRAAAEQARAAASAPVAAGAAPAARVTPTLTADTFIQDQRHSELAEKNSEDAVYASPIFRPGVKVKDQAPPQQATVPGILTPQQMVLQQAAAQQAAMGSANAQAANLLASKFGQQPGTSTTPQRDTDFIKTTAAHFDGQDFASAGFVGQAHGCTLSPPHHFIVLTIEGLNSDRPGTASLMVEQNVYDSIRGDCLMIPKGTMITAPYSSDIQPGQESILVAATEMRLPNGEHVSLYGAQGADADGTAGFSGDVNNHFLKIYGTSFLTAILLGAFDKNGTSSTTTGPLGVTQVGSTAGQVAAQTSQSILSRYQNIPPTVTVKPGQRFMIKVNRDIHLEPYRDD